MSALLRSEIIWVIPIKGTRSGYNRQLKKPGESRATDIIEQIVSTGKPVLRYETQLNFG